MPMLKRAVIVAVLLTCFAGTGVHGQTGTVVGTVRTTLPEGETLAIPGVSVTLKCGSGVIFSYLSDDDGRFRFAHLPLGTCSLITDMQGFRSVSTAVEIKGTKPLDLPLSVELEAMYSGLMVIGDPVDTAVRQARSLQRVCPEEKRDEP